ncbi:hypothetical protein ACFL3H_06320 [Gemmatimonadota bacterium]
MKAKMSPTNQLITLISIFTALAITVTALPLAAQDVVVLPDVERHYPGTGYGLAETYTPEHMVISENWSMHGDEPQEPPEIRIMNRIIRAALEEVKAPELPEQLGESTNPHRAYVTTGIALERRDTGYAFAPLPGNIQFLSGSQKVTGFYMEGYGYLFTVRWPIRQSNLLSTFAIGGGDDLVISLQTQNRALEELLTQREQRSQRAVAGRADVAPPVEEAERAAEAEQADLERQQEMELLRENLAAWQSEFEDLIVDALKDVMATYGHTLHQAADDEKVTLIFQPGDEEEQNISLSVESGSLGGPGQKDAALRAITVTRGSAESNPALKSQIRIMSEIIDAAFEEGSSVNDYYAVAGRSYYVGGNAHTQYIPGYGIIFTKSARMNFMTVLEAVPVPNVPDPPGSRSGAGNTETESRVTYRGMLSMTGEEASEASRERLREHFDNLKQKTAEVFATYGNTLTELKADEWVGINYEVGSSAGLLQSGVSNYMVLARMSDVLQALRQSDGVAWLLERLVTNEKMDE